ncbi:MAG: short-chain dehydrogenase [Verrucomicrobiales bacterium]|nr:short-chain dehydrogenase [Verrucomicrobiales bacterium]
MHTLQDKVIIVTGSTMGIGESIARGAVQAGARVLVHGLEQEEGQRVADSLGPQAVFHGDDLADPAAAPRLVDAAVRAFGRIDALVNNAAWVVRGRIGDVTPEFFDRCMAVNVRAPLLLIQAALPHLSASRGCVVNIGSVNAYCGEENLLPYSISKGALLTLTRNLGDTLHRQHGVRVNQINPGWVLTEAEQHRKHAEGMPADWPAHLPKMFAPAGRLFTPQEIAATVLHFLSDEFGPVSGSVIDLEQHPFIGRNPPKL